MSTEKEPRKPQPKESPPERKVPVREADTPGRKTFTEPDIKKGPSIDPDEPWPTIKK